LETALQLSGYGSGYGSAPYAYSYGYDCGCGWSFPILRGVVGFVSNLGALIFGYGYGGYGYAGGYADVGNFGQPGGYYDANFPTGFGYGGTGTADFPFGPGTPYSNPSYVWTPNGPIYNNPAYNPLPTSGVAAGTVYQSGISGCTPSVYDQTRGWIAYGTATNVNAPLCNGQPAPSGIGPVVGTAYTTGAPNCTPATFTANGWIATGAQTQTGAPLCDGNAYASVTGPGGAVNEQMPSFAPTFTSNGSSYAYKYTASYDDASYRYYIYGR
jgi:hypothetical protein